MSHDLLTHCGLRCVFSLFCSAFFCCRSVRILSVIVSCTDVSEETTQSKEEVVADDTVPSDVTHESTLDVTADERTPEEEHVRIHSIHARTASRCYIWVYSSVVARRLSL